MWTGWKLHREFDLVVCLLVRSYFVSFKILHSIPHSTTMEPCAVCGFPPLSIGALDCRDRNIAHGFRQIGCHISIYVINLFTLSNLWNLFIWTLPFTSVFELGVSCLPLWRLHTYYQRTPHRLEAGDINFIAGKCCFKYGVHCMS